MAAKVNGWCDIYDDDFDNMIHARRAAALVKQKTSLLLTRQGDCSPELAILVSLVSLFIARPLVLLLLAISPFFVSLVPVLVILVVLALCIRIPLVRDISGGEFGGQGGGDRGIVANE